MKARYFLSAVAAAAALAAPAAVAGGLPCDDITPANRWDQPAAFSTHSETGRWIGFRKRIALLALRREGLDMQTADGGTLTGAHRAYLQSKLDAIQNGRY